MNSPALVVDLLFNQFTIDRIDRDGIVSQSSRPREHRIKAKFNGVCSTCAQQFNALVFPTDSASR